MDSKTYHDLANQLAIAKGMADGVKRILTSEGKDDPEKLAHCISKLEKTSTAITRIQTMLLEYRKTTDSAKAS